MKSVASTVYELKLEGLEEWWPRLPKSVQQVLCGLADGGDLNTIMQLSGLNEETSAALVDKLVALGVLAPKKTFSVQEEDFFAAEVMPIDLCDEPLETWRGRWARRLARIVPIPLPVQQHRRPWAAAR